MTRGACLRLFRQRRIGSDRGRIKLARQYFHRARRAEASALHRPPPGAITATRWARSPPAQRLAPRALCAAVVVRVQPCDAASPIMKSTIMIEAEFVARLRRSWRPNSSVSARHGGGRSSPSRCGRHRRLRAGAGGIFRSVRDICNRHGALLIFDEVMCGMGRTGTRMRGNRKASRPTSRPSQGIGRRLSADRRDGSASGQVIDIIGRVPACSSTVTLISRNRWPAPRRSRCRRSSARSRLLERVKEAWRTARTAAHRALSAITGMSATSARGLFSRRSSWSPIAPPARRSIPR